MIKTISGCIQIVIAWMNLMWLIEILRQILLSGDFVRQMLVFQLLASVLLREILTWWWERLQE